jgi:hypothetical protein
MKNKKVVKLAEKKLKKTNKWLKKFSNVDMGHMDGTYEQVNNTKEICEMILKYEKSKS